MSVKPDLATMCELRAQLLAIKSGESHRFDRPGSYSPITVARAGGDRERTPVQDWRYNIVGARFGNDAFLWRGVDATVCGLLFILGAG